MPREADIRKKAITILEKEKWIVWWPAKVKFKQTDIFGVFDLICWKQKKDNLRMIQLTTLSNLSSRRKKIQSFFLENKISCRSPKSVTTEIWAWGAKNKAFKIESI